MENVNARSGFSSKKFLTVLVLFFVIGVVLFSFLRSKSSETTEEVSPTLGYSYALNTNKSEYSLNEKVLVFIAVAGPDGRDVCSGNFELVVTDPEGSEIKKLSTSDGTLEVSSTCTNSATNDADFTLDFDGFSEGTYTVRLTDTESNSDFEKEIIVKGNHEFSLERSGATRVTTGDSFRFHMILTLVPKNDFKGQLVEKMPLSANVLWQGPSVVESTEDGKTITWDVDLKAGEATGFIYEYAVSGEAVGQIELGKAVLLSESGKTIFEEVGAWKVLVEEEKVADTPDDSKVDEEISKGVEVQESSL